MSMFLGTVTKDDGVPTEGKIKHAATFDRYGIEPKL